MREASLTKAVVGRDASPFVVLPLELWEQIEDTLAELGSPRLLKTIVAGRAANRRGRIVPYAQLRKTLHLA